VTTHRKIVTDRPSFQGDMMVRRVDPVVLAVPATVSLAAREGDHYVVAHSETGHHHVIAADTADFFTLPDVDKVVGDVVGWIRTVLDTELVHKRSHDTHESLFLPAGGTYEVRHQRQFELGRILRAED
jgi:hypothetical protein